MVANYLVSSWRLIIVISTCCFSHYLTSVVIRSFAETSSTEGAGNGGGTRRRAKETTVSLSPPRNRYRFDRLPPEEKTDLDRRLNSQRELEVQYRPWHARWSRWTIVFSPARFLAWGALHASTPKTILSKLKVQSDDQTHRLRSIKNFHVAKQEKTFSYDLRLKRSIVQKILGSKTISSIVTRIYSQ